MSEGLTFFCELDTPELDRLLRRADVISSLQALRAHVSVALTELTGARAAAIRRLNDAGIPVHGWLLVPRDDGYFATLDNADLFVARYDEVKAWMEEHTLAFVAFGLDVELDIRKLEGLVNAPLSTAVALLRQAFTRDRLERAVRTYSALLERIRAEGYLAETYQFPLVLDARSAQSKLLQRLAGLMDLRADREVLMLYSSLIPVGGEQVLRSYAKEAQAIAVGSTGGGIDTLPKLSFDALSRDLRIAAAYTGHVYVYSLEGCADRGMLEAIRSIDWDAPVEVQPSWTMETARGFLQKGARVAEWLAGLERLNRDRFS